MCEDVYVGVDVAKNTVDIALGPQGEVFTLPNSAAGFGALIKLSRTIWWRWWSQRPLAATRSSCSPGRRL